MGTKFLSNAWRVNRSSVDYGVCVPMVSPGSDFWKSGSSSQVCAQATAECVVEVVKTYGKNPLTGAKKLESIDVRDNECLIQNGENFEVDPTWGAKVNAICSAVGDCGAGFNFNEVFVNDGYEWKYRNMSYYFLEQDLGLLTRPLLPGTGEVVKDYFINNKYQLKQGESVYIKG